ncbi:MbnP family protein [Hydrotalea sp.]|uniref:MbnP family protein n=1 Tax=Hydrotalea sp. TaxID=2881279 RepID=UPI003D15082F
MKQLYLLILGLLVVISSFAQSLQLKFIPLAGNTSLVLNDSIYQTKAGEPITVRKFLFYVSHIHVKDVHGNTIPVKNNYYLFSASDTATWNIQLPIQPQILSAVSFTIGVDSIKNVSGIQTGALDPMLGMFWTWNTGYIFAKLEGNSTVSPLPQQTFSYHVGGYKHNENASKTIHIPINSSHKVSTIIIGANVLNWFNGVNDLSIKAHPLCHSPGKLAMQIADNYSKMFQLLKVQ